MVQLTLTRPDDWHLHLRDGPAMVAVVTATARCFARAIVMPNLKPPILTVEQALAYRERICVALAPNSRFNPLMTLYLTDNLPTEEIIKAKTSGQIMAVKYYPAGATTHAELGVTHWQRVTTVLETMQTEGVPLLIHGEVTDEHIDIFDREKIFLTRVLDPLLSEFPALKVVLEHITTQEAVEYVQDSNANLAATITAHHLLMNRNDLFNGGIHPHHYCLPILKREQHRQALLQAATSGNPKFFLGTDSAPHARTNKETACGCAGIYTAPAALELYAEAFEQVQALDKLEGFASYYGADFYGLPRNVDKVTLIKQTWSMPNQFEFGDNDVVIPWRAGRNINWQRVPE